MSYPAPIRFVSLASETPVEQCVLSWLQCRIQGTKSTSRTRQRHVLRRFYPGDYDPGRRESLRPDRGAPRQKGARSDAGSLGEGAVWPRSGQASGPLELGLAPAEPACGGEEREQWRHGNAEAGRRLGSG
jgi:hypothetical protein